MHNDRMRGVVCAAAVLLALAGCSEADDQPSADATPSASGGTSSAETSAAESSPAAPTEEVETEAPYEPYLPVPAGVVLTDQGSDLEVGDAATIAWEPRKQVVGALTIRVTRLQQATLKALSAFRLDPSQKRSAPYYVRATVKNVGKTNLAGVSVPLYLVDGRDTLIQATPFAATFKPCPSKALPKPFRTGTKAAVCLVYLVPDRGTLEAVSFRPTQEYDPITWAGKLE